jgi:hypothetical protein
MLIELLDILEHELHYSLSQSGVKIRLPLSSLIISNNDLASCKINFLVFNHRERQPILILRIAQSDDQRAPLRNEYETLGRLVKYPAVVGAIPFPVGLFEFNNYLIAVEGSLPGISLFTLLQRGKHTHPFWVRRDFKLACDFLFELEQVTTDGYTPFPDANMVQSKFDQLSSTYALLNMPKDYEKQLLEIADEHRSLMIMRCGRHGDYWPGNLLLSPKGIGVIDWEGFTYPDNLFHDIFFFTTTYALCYPWSAWKSRSTEKAFFLGFIEENWLSTIIKETLELFFLKVNVPPRAMFLLFNLFMIEMSLPSAITNDPRDPPQYSKWFNIFQTLIQCRSQILAR